MATQFIVIGGGAAGFFCAVNTARLHPDWQVIILEKTGKVLSKVKVSGGGRCNLTHACFDIPEMSKRYPRGEHFVRKAFHQFFTVDSVKWFEGRGVALKAEKDGRMFPVSDSSQSVIDCLLQEAARYKVDVRMNTAVTGISMAGSQFVLELASGGKLKADYLVIASGGYPRSSMFDWIRAIGHRIEEPVPSLFTFNLPGHSITGLMGLSVEQAIVKVQGTKLEEQGPLLITHWGLSGPAILRLSAWGARDLAEKNWHFNIMINWLPGKTEQRIREIFMQSRRESAAQKFINKNVFGLPQRLWELLAEQSGVMATTRWADLPSKEQNRMIRNLCQYELEVKGKTSFKEEFVTAGGVSLKEVDPNTMMSKKIPNLFFCGEVLDVDGITGGYNFQFAWTSGAIVSHAGEKTKV